MADPVTAGLSAVSTGMTVLGGLTTASGQQRSGAANYQSLMYQSAIANTNAQIAEQNAEYALNAGEQSAVKYGMGAAQRAGQIKAAQGSAGLDVNSGSAKQVQESQKFVSDMDMTQIRSNAAKVAYDYQNQAQNFRNEATLKQFGAVNARSAGNIAAAGTLISTAGSVADKWLKGSSVGMFGGGGSSGDDGGYGYEA